MTFSLTAAILFTNTLCANQKTTAAEQPTTNTAPQPETAATAKTFRRVTLEEFQKLAAAGKAVAIDVRSPTIYELGHLPDALSVPVGLLDEKLETLPQDKVLVAYCTCKNEELSGEWIRAAAQRGITNTAALLGGYRAWVDGGHQVIRTAPPEVPPPPAVAMDSPETETPGSGSGGRIMTPDWIPCAREQVSGHFGRVTSYERAMGKTTVVIATDSGTTETVTLLHPGSKDPSRFFRIYTDPFTENDWKRLEASEGKLLPKVRAHAWVCSTAGHPAIIDWRPGEVASTIAE